MKIAVFGSNGFIGSAIFDYFNNRYEYENVIGITRINQYYFKNEHFDIFINCAGNSKKYWANDNREKDFELSVKSVYNSLFDFKFDKYIYISSIDALHNNLYGYHKRIAEEMIINKCKDYIILRCNVVIGKNMKKGLVYDILNEIPIYLTSDSKIRVITNTEIAKIIPKIIYDKNRIYSLGSLDTITPIDIGNIINKTVKYSNKLERQIYDDDICYLRSNLKIAKEYIKEIL